RGDGRPSPRSCFERSLDAKENGPADETRPAAQFPPPLCRALFLSLLACQLLHEAAQRLVLPPVGVSSFLGDGALLLAAVHGVASEGEQSSARGGARRVPDEAPRHRSGRRPCRPNPENGPTNVPNAGERGAATPQ